MKSRLKNTFFKKKKTINYLGKILELSTPVVMGVINITPDSFYDGGKYENKKEILKRAEQILSEGGAIIDIGACSTRPGKKCISEREEIKRLLPAVEIIRQKFQDAILSIDTFRSNIVRKLVLEYGDCIINDISGGTLDDKMFTTIAELQLPYIMMHIKGTPQNMQNNPVYDDLIKDIIKYFSEKLVILQKIGVKDVILDPGFGFGKTLEQNYELLKNLAHFKIFQLPLMVGISRKSMIFKLLNTTPQESLNGSTVLNTIALLNGADILRVHDVKQAVEVIKIVEKLKS